MASLDALFSTPVVADVLRLFLQHPNDAYYQRLIAEKTGHTLFQVQKALERMEEAALVTKTKDGKRVYYQANIAHPSFHGLQEAFQQAPS